MRWTGRVRAFRADRRLISRDCLHLKFDETPSVPGARDRSWLRVPLHDRRMWRRGGPSLTAALTSRRPLQRDRRGLVSETDRTPEQAIAADTVWTLVWLLETPAVDRRRYRMVNRLRMVRDREDFATLPEDLRERVRQIVAESES
jgi:hypothetical protein